MVSSLIDSVSRWWKIEAIRTLFLPFEVDTILKISLSHNLPEDKLIWIGNKRGEFTVKMCLLCWTKLLDTKDEGECSTGDPNAQLWKKMWSLKLPAKIKIFSWWVGVNGLPVLTNMVAKGMQISCVCLIYGEETENLIHALISCDYALSVWPLWQDRPIKVLLNAKDFIGLVHQISSYSIAKHLEFFFAISWSIWCPWWEWSATLANLAKNIVEDFYKAISVDFPLKQTIQRGWVAPLSSYFKVNVDGDSSIDGCGTSGVGVIIRNGQEGWLQPFVRIYPCIILLIGRSSLQWSKVFSWPRRWLFPMSYSNLMLSWSFRQFPKTSMVVQWVT